MRQVGVDDREVGIQARPDRAGNVLQAVHLGAPRRVGPEDHLGADGLPGQERLGRGAAGIDRHRPIHRDVRAPERIGAGDGPVAASRKRSPGREQGPERVLPAAPALAEEGDGEVVHLRLVRGPQRLDVGRRRQGGESRDVVGMHYLQVGQMVSLPAGAVRRSGGLDGVERVPHGAVSERVEVNLEALPVQRRHEARQFSGVDEVQPRDLCRAAVAVQVRLEHRGGVVLSDAVEHHLHAGRAEPARLPVPAAVDQLRHLLDAALPVPPQRADHVGLERAGRDRAQVRVDRVRQARAGCRRSRPASR